jgi:putative solute:sodium symporter small subunit
VSIERRIGSKTRARAMFDSNEYTWPAMPDLKAQFRRSGLKNLVLVMLAGWVFYFLAVNLFILRLNKIIVPIIGLPLGFYMAVQGSIVVFVIFLFWFARNERMANSE